MGLIVKEKRIWRELCQVSFVKNFLLAISMSMIKCQCHCQCLLCLHFLLPFSMSPCHNGFHCRRISQKQRWSSSWRNDQRWLRRKIGEICKFNTWHGSHDYFNFFVYTLCTLHRYLATKKQFGLRPQFTELIMLCKPCRWVAKLKRALKVKYRKKSIWVNLWPS